MQKIVEENFCSGCHACFNVCPNKCIEMVPDKDGFCYPCINESECIDCNKCKNACPIVNKEKISNVGKAYAAINRDERVRLESSSGGVFTLLAKTTINKGGTVFGAAFDEKFNVNHIAIDSLDEIYKLRGSKYVQSEIGESYRQAKTLLDVGKYVLFTGTPCQISGLKSYLKKDYETLITQDIICHGVPSPKVWQEYIQYRESKAKAQSKRIFFRNKKYGWKTFSVLFEYANGSKYMKNFSDDLYMKAFLQNLSLRPSCYSCHSKSLERESDITLADFWGCQNVVPDMDDDKGLSLVLVNSEKGKKIFGEISDKMEYREVDIYEATRYNTSAYQSVPQNKKRNKFLATVNSKNFDQIVKKLTKRSFFKRIFSKIKRIIKRMCN